VSAAVGFICLAGVAVLNGLVVMTAIRDHSEAGMPVAEAIRAGMADKMRAVIMTGFVPAIGFVPMALAHGTGAEVQKPLATTVIGGLVAATILTLLVLPAIARVVLGWGERRVRPEGTEPGAPAGLGDEPESSVLAERA
ncbi:MAG: efflux RND transporter permease subunit, partial [Sphingobium limneticum]